MRNNKKYCIAVLIAAAAVMMAGCAKEKEPEWNAPAIDLAELKDPVVEADFTGAEIEVLQMENPIDFSYSYNNADMVFKMRDGVWKDALDSSIPINQEKFQAMADNFLNLHAVSLVTENGNPNDYGLAYPAYSCYITDAKKGEIYISIGGTDEAGNYYMTVDNSKIYTIRPETAESLVLDYDALVVRDGLELTVTAADIKRAEVTKNGETILYKEDNTEALTRIAAGLTALRPQIFATYHATKEDLVSSDLTAETRMTLRAEVMVDGELKTVTIHVGTFADVMETVRYMMLDGSQMVSLIETPVIGDLLNLTEEENRLPV